MVTPRRRRALARLSADWLLPYGLEHRSDAGPAANLTPIGTVASTWRPVVDERGLVTPWFGGWSLDWWIGADDRWHFPSRETGVRQRLVAGAPVVETAMHIPGGDAVERVYAIRGDEELAIVEVINRSPVPMAVAFAIRPANPYGFAVIRRIELKERTVLVDGRRALLLPRPPRVMAGTNFAGGDSAHVVTEGRAGPTLPSPLRCDVGLAQAAFVLPLPHAASLRVALPLAAPPRARRSPSLRRPRPDEIDRAQLVVNAVHRPEFHDHNSAANAGGAADATRSPRSLPTGEEVARSWLAMTRGGMGLELPPGAWADAIDANRRLLLLAHTGDAVRSRPHAESGPLVFGDAARLLAALDRFGFHAQAAEVLRSYPARQGRDGSFSAADGHEANATASALSAMADHWRLSGDEDLVRDLLTTTAAAVRAIVRARRSGRTPEQRSQSARGLIDGADLLDAAGRPEEAHAARVQADRLTADLDAGPRTTVDASQLAIRAASPTWCWPGCDALAGAEFLLAVRNLLVREPGGGPATLELCSMLPDAWRGQGIEVHDAPTAHGVLSYAVRWHGERPALLWDLRARPGTGVVVLRAPALDPLWSTDASRGEALLAATPTGSFT